MTYVSVVELSENIRPSYNDVINITLHQMDGLDRSGATHLKHSLNLPVVEPEDVRQFEEALEKTFEGMGFDTYEVSSVEYYNENLRIYCSRQPRIVEEVEQSLEQVSTMFSKVYLSPPNDSTMFSKDSIK